jgi:glyoxylate reductase
LTAPELVAAANAAGGEAPLVLVCLLTDPISADVVRGIAHLVHIATFSIGFSHIDLAACRARGVTVSNTPIRENTVATADCAMTLLLGAARRVAEADAYTRSGDFSRLGPKSFMGLPFSGKTVGIVGLGAIGTAVAERCALGFGCRVLYASRAAKPDVEARIGARRVPLDELLAQADFISVHTALCPETVHYIGARELALCKPTAVLVNTSRGPVVDEAALVAALQSGALAAAGLDVYEREPALAPGLAACANTVLLPHVGTATPEACDAMAASVAASVAQFLAGEKIVCAVE